MDSDHHMSKVPPSGQGGAVEPARRRSPPAARLLQAPEASGERYELRDRSADVVHRTASYAEMVAKAGQLGASLFVAVSPDGRRTSIEKHDGHWQRGPQRPASTPRPDPAPDPQEQARSLNASGAPRPAPPPAQGQPERAAGPVVGEPPADSPDRIADAETAARIARLEASLRDRFVIQRAPVALGDMAIGRSEYRYRGGLGRVAFTESAFQLATDTNSPFVARSMVDVAEARRWHTLRVSGHEEFRRTVWLEASLRGLKTLGHEPSTHDRDLLARELELRRANRVESARQATAPSGPGEQARPAAPGGGRNAVLAAIEALLVAQGIPDVQRAAVMAAAAEQLAQRVREGRAPKLRLYDAATNPSRSPVTPAPERQRGAERSRATPVR